MWPFALVKTHKLDQGHRDDVDGLRALAVLIVVLFHAGFDFLGGGYVGVDVFFVISGFVITRSVRGDLTQGRFNFVRFYRRRIRRLMPASIATALACLAFGYFYLTPEQMQDLGMQSITSVFWISNIYFWLKTGYFDLAASSKPLLHMWSLGVEEQFYLFWPLTLVMLTRLKQAWITPAVIVAASLISVFTAQLVLPTNQTMAFYLMPFRIAEFGFGALLTFVTPGRLWRAEIALLIGLTLIIVAVLTFSETTPFPGLSSLIPCTGAALTIYGGQAAYVGSVLRHPMALGIGRISYSFYLTHWPAVVFYKSAHRGDDLANIDSCLIVAISLILAIAMYFLVERPFREAKHNPTSRKFALLTTAIAALVTSAAAASAYVSDGWMWRLAPELRAQIEKDPRANDDFVWASLRRRNISFSTHLPDDPPTPTYRMLIVGDSMSGDLVNIIERAGLTKKALVRTSIVPVPCQPVISIDGNTYHNIIAAHDHRSCDDSRQKFENDTRLNEADLVVLAANWRAWSPEFLPGTISFIQNHGPDVVVVGAKAMSVTSQQLLMEALTVDDYLSYRPATPNETSVTINAKIKAISESKGAGYIDLLTSPCDTDGRCRLFADDGKLIYFDTVHLASSGVDFFARHSDLSPLIVIPVQEQQKHLHRQPR